MEVNLILLPLLFITVLNYSNATHIKSFERKLGVALEMYTESKTNSQTGVKNIGKCAAFCKENDCLSFGYNKTNNKCDTYSSIFMEETNVELTSSVFFSKLPESCDAIGPDSPSGVYRIALTSGESLDVYCDMISANGPWTVIQNRYDGSVDFYRTWNDYKNGFGYLNGEFWIGNDVIHILTQTHSVLRIELEAFSNKRGYAEYTNFRITDESGGYTLTLTGSARNVSRDAMSCHSSKSFSAKDKGADIGCAVSSRSGWWYCGCHQANLNGIYTTNQGAAGEHLLTWWYFPGPAKKIPLKRDRMMIRPARG